MTIDLGDVTNTGHWSAAIPLTTFATLYDLSTAAFIAQVRLEPGASAILMEWKSGGSLITPGNSIAYDNASKILMLDTPSPGLIAAFPYGGNFWLEVGFYLAAEPTDLRRIGDGQFPVGNGVIR